MNKLNEEDEKGKKKNRQNPKTKNRKFLPSNLLTKTWGEEKTIYVNFEL